jgi:hypothetical protein
LRKHVFTSLTKDIDWGNTIIILYQ